VGEALLAVPLVRALRERFPEKRIVVSTGTPTGQDMARERLAPFCDAIFYVPFDFPWAVRATMRAVKPGLLLVLETEIWPNLYREAKRHGASLLLANARISDKSAPRYQRLRRLFAPVLAKCDAILAQSALDAQRFIAAGAPADSVRVAGNVKYDFQPGSSALPAQVADLLDRLRPEPILVAASTREGEEALVVAAFQTIAEKRPKALLIVAPRHPRRFDEAYETLRASGLPVVRRSALGAGPELPAILLLDSLGELSSVYPTAAAVFVGGSLNGWGGHNVLEPALCGRPAVVGPFMQNFREVADRLLAGDAMIQIGSAEQLAPALAGLLDDPARADAMGARGRAVAEAERGATGRVVDTASSLLCEAAPFEPPGLAKRVALGPLSLLWAAGAALHARFRSTPKRLPHFTLCVGNLTAGGSGKTPATLRLAERLALCGHSPAILTRGYRRRSAEPTLVIEPFAEANPARVGDEAAVLAERLALAGAEAPIGVGADRHASGTALAKAYPVDLFLLDDGFSHHALARDFNLVLVDVTRPLFEEPFLPLGRRREPFRALARADAFLLTRTVRGCNYEALAGRLKRYAPEAPVFRSRVRPTQLRSADRAPRSPLEPDELQGKRVAAFGGLGNPTGFYTTLERAGAAVVSRTAFRDHHRYSLDDWWRIAAAARDSGADIVVTTEKDIANLAAEVPPEMRTGAPALYALVIEMEIDEEQALLDWIEHRMREREP
jgi:tetraacyldisaccharide 4'-kinase